MPGQKQYEMLFRLNAQLNGGFTGTFSKAQAEYSKLGKEIRDLNRQQNDIAAYQRQQSAVENTRTKLENLRQQHDLLQKEINETTTSTAALEREKLKLEQRISDTESALERQTQKLETTDAKLKEAGIDTANLAQKDAELTSQISELQAKQKEAEDGATSYGESASAAFEIAAQALASAGIAAALHEIYEAYMECIGVAGDFEESMSTVKALSDASAEEMAALSATAKELGATTKFTAKESADAMGYMAMAGWDAVDMIGGMDGVLQLAAASGEDLAMVSDIVTDSLSAFGLKASDTAHFSDVLAAAATNSNTNVATMGETFKMSASVAGALGYSIEDVAVAIGLMANSGVKGSIAGTALRNTFNGLLEGVTLTGAAFGEYEYTAVKADGTMKDFGSTIDELRVYFAQMTEAERVNNAMTIAGQRGYNGLLAILNATNEDYTSLASSINNCTGAAQRMADVRLDNMNGQLTLMNSAWEAVKTTIGEQYTPVLQEAYSVGADVLSGLNSFLQAHPEVIKATTAGVAVVGTATAALTAYAAIRKIVNLLDGSPLLGAIGPIAGGIALVAGLTAVLTGLYSALDAENKEYRELTASSREQYDELKRLNEEYEAAKELYAENSDEVLALRYEIDELSAAYESSKQSLKDFVAETDSVIEAHNNTIASYQENTAAIADEEQGVLALVYKLDELTQKTALSEVEQDQLLAIVKSLNSSVPELALNYDKTTSSLNRTTDAVREMVKAQAEREREAERYRTWVELYKEEATLTEQLEKAKKNLAASEDQYIIDPNVMYGYAIITAETDKYREEVERLTEALEENESAQAEMGYEQEQAAEAGGELRGVIDATFESVAALTAAYNEAYGAALESVSGQYALWETAAEVVATSADTINSALESQIGYWDDYNVNLESLRERSSDIEGLSEVIATFADGSAESVNAIAGLANASDEDLREMVANWKELQDAQKAASQSIADLKTDFSNQMDELTELLAEDIAAMDMNEGAAESGRSTIQGYINAASDMLPQVKEAYRALAEAALQELDLNIGGNNSGGGDGDWVNYYASGTPNAQRGAAIVGENGPELVFMGGGETVLNARQTAAVMARPVSAVSAVPFTRSADGGSINIEMPIHIDGNASEETVQALQSNADAIVQRVLTAIDERDEDNARRSYRT